MSDKALVNGTFYISFYFFINLLLPRRYRFCQELFAKDLISKSCLLEITSL